MGMCRIHRIHRDHVGIPGNISFRDNVTYYLGLRV